MRYMQSFHRRLVHLRDTLKLSQADIARICSVDEAEVDRWESSDTRYRSYPSVVELMDLCLRTETTLETLLDFEDLADAGQLELPGLTFGNGHDLNESLAQLEKEIGRLQLTEDETELLRRFRKNTSENRRMVIQLLG
ncbi:MAG: XRE family transcriptional regulator [Marinobacter sp.]|uniref:XRE family transcriptional regulator n=1 Tax=Marinobacter sp. TaxID=50741 RepID=UPI0034A04DD5